MRQYGNQCTLCIDELKASNLDSLLGKKNVKIHKNCMMLLFERSTKDSDMIKCDKCKEVFKKDDIVQIKNAILKKEDVLIESKSADETLKTSIPLKEKKIESSNNQSINTEKKIEDKKENSIPDPKALEGNVEKIKEDQKENKGEEKIEIELQCRFIKILEGHKESILKTEFNCEEFIKSNEQLKDLPQPEIEIFHKLYKEYVSKAKDIPSNIPLPISNEKDEAEEAQKNSNKNENVEKI